MAYRDMNGKVMIDEAAAQADIRQERQAEQRRPPLLAAGPEMEADLREFAVREGGV